MKLVASEITSAAATTDEIRRTGVACLRAGEDFRPEVRLPQGPAGAVLHTLDGRHPRLVVQERELPKMSPGAWQGKQPNIPVC